MQRKEGKQTYTYLNVNYTHLSPVTNVYNYPLLN